MQRQWHTHNLHTTFIPSPGLVFFLRQVQKKVFVLTLYPKHKVIPNPFHYITCWIGETTLSPFFSAGMHTSISEILKEKSLKPSRCSLPCLAQSQTHPNNLSHFLSVPLNPEPKANTNTHSVHASCTNITPQSTGAVIHASTYYCCYKYRLLTYTTLHTLRPTMSIWNLFEYITLDTNTQRAGVISLLFPTMLFEWHATTIKLWLEN